MAQSIRGVGVDRQGRCVHWHSERDIVANRCWTCQEFFACSLCHEELTNHPFGPAPLSAPAAMCGACGLQMSFAEYGPACVRCGHFFNPGCAAHAHIYFRVR